jgi:hypothetical protein
MTLSPVPYALQQGSHPAALFRQAFGFPLSPAGGIAQPGDLALTQNGTPNMSCNVGAGRIAIPGTSLATVNTGGGAYYPQGLYFGESDAPTNLPISASSPSLPRIDTIIGQVEDAAYAGSNNDAKFVVLTGTPTAGASYPSNLTGAASVPVSSMVLGYVNVAANATSIVTANITSVATQARLGYDTGWVALTLATNVSAQAGYYVPSARLIGDRVWLKGAAVDSAAYGGTPFLFATLPVGLRPSSTIGEGIETSNGPTLLTITSAGVMSSYTSTGAGNIWYLDDLSFSTT